MRLDNDQTLLIRMIALLSRIGARLFADVGSRAWSACRGTGAVILAINHASNADPFVTGAWITPALHRGGSTGWASGSCSSGRCSGGWRRSGGVHPVERGTADVEAFRLATRILERGYVLLIFPEGTRSPTGALQEARTAWRRSRMRTDATIVPDRGQRL